MGRGAFLKTSFNAGELSPLLDGRSDLEKYPQGCSLLQNFIPTVQGPIYHRPGTQFVDDLGPSSPVLVPFIYNRDQAYVLAISSSIHVYADRGVVESSPGVPYTFGAGVWSAPPRRADGSSRLSFTQSGDVLFVCDAEGGHPMYSIKRLGHTSWTIEATVLAHPPHSDVVQFQAWIFNITPTVGDPLPAGTFSLGVYTSASAQLFQDATIRGKISFDMRYRALAPFDHVKEWTAGGTYSTGDVIHCQGRFYFAKSGGTLSSSPLTHEYLNGTNNSDLWYIGNGEIAFDIVASGFNHAASPGHYCAKVVFAACPSGMYRGDDMFPANNWNDRFQTSGWYRPAIRDSELRGSSDPLGAFPDNVAIFRDRLVLSVNRTLYASVAGDFYDFSNLDRSGQVVADCGMQLDLLAGDLSPVSWMAASDRLVLGSPGGERTIGEQNVANAFGPTNVKVEVTAATGSVDVGPALVGRDILMLDRTGRRLIRTALTQDGQGFANLSALTDHFGLESPFIAMAWREVPTPVLFLASAAGQLVGCTFDPAQDVTSWHRHDVGGLVRDIVAIPSLDGTRDDLWLVVERTVLGSQRFYLEVMPDEYRMGLKSEDARYLDCSISYDGAPASTFSGLGHLEGETVQAVGDGIVFKDLEVSLGSVTLPGDPVSKVTIGKYQAARVRTMRLHLGADDGVNMGKIGRLTKASARLVDTVNLRAGGKFSDMNRLDFRDGGQNMDIAVPAQSEERLWSPKGGYSTEAYLCLEQDQPLPATIVSLGLEFEVNG